MVLNVPSFAHGVLANFGLKSFRLEEDLPLCTGLNTYFHHEISCSNAEEVFALIVVPGQEKIRPIGR